jgi:cold shock CspA family protein
MYIFIHISAVKVKEVMNLKASQMVYIGGFWEKKGHR